MNVVELFPKQPWRYAVPLLNAATGEQRTVVVTLSDAECADAVRHARRAGRRGPGGHDGPIVRGYAMRRAQAEALPGFEASPAADFINTH